MGSIAIIGGGPAGLMAADRLADSGHTVAVYDHMPSVGRKFLMAGRGGLNLTHSETLPRFLSRYGAALEWLEPALSHFPPEALRDWCHKLGQPTFVGSSGRVFPETLKASPLLRALLRRLDEKGVKFALKHRWLGWAGDQLSFETPAGKITVNADATLLALGGASWPRLGSDGNWVEILQQRDVEITPLQPANCGFMAPWSDFFADRYAGQPLKPITLSFGERSQQGEAMITAQGIEGGVVYALSSVIRDAVTQRGRAVVTLDLRPGLDRAELTARLESLRGSRSLTNHLRKYGGLSPAAIGLLYEAQGKDAMQSASPQQLAAWIKACDVTLTATAAMDRAISSAGGIARDTVDEDFMLRKLPGVFAAGEMLDWEAPTGGYLLQASFSTAVMAADGIMDWIKKHDAV